MEKKIQYAAFLSHRSPDKKAAALLQNRIERYVIPREIRKERAQRGRTPGKVCLDSNDFATNELKNEIMEKLDASRKMILLCSPCSASPAPGNRDWSRDPSQVEDWSASPSETGWVGFEIDYMLKQGRLGDIIPVVVDGDSSESRFQSRGVDIRALDILDIFLRLLFFAFGICCRKLDLAHARIHRSIVRHSAELTYDVYYARAVQSGLVPLQLGEICVYLGKSALSLTELAVLRLQLRTLRSYLRGGFIKLSLL